MKKKHLLVIERITKNVPKQLLDSLLVKKPIAEVSHEIVKRGLEDPDVDAETKEKLQAKIDSGFFDKTVEVTDTEVEKKIAEYYDTEIKKAITLGLLPKKDKSIIKKIKKYGKRAKA